MKKLLIPLLTCMLIAGCGNGSDDDNEGVVVPAWSDSPEVQTLIGMVLGISDANNTWTWKGIPYAAPPMGELRFKAPGDPSPWEDTLSAAEYGSECTQYSQTGEGLIGSEDCLTLNVWRPQTNEQNLPVYVWIHGGGNTVGTSGIDYQDGANLAAKSNVVYVSMNYRLGPFGWLFNQALLDGDPVNDSGNYGTLDIIKSLEWIRDNIERFGGDPNNVFITGESAGGINVLSLLISPKASGLFHKAMSQSGLLAEIDLESAADFSDGLLPDILVAEGLAADPAAAAAALSSMSNEEIRDVLVGAEPASLMAAIPPIGSGLLSMPILFADGHVIVENGSDSFAEGNYPNRVPLILGTNSGDVRLFLFILGGDISEDVPLYNAVSDIGGMLWKAGGADDIARAIVDYSDQPDVYVYSFEWGRYATDGSAVTAAPFNYLVGAAHSVDIPFFLDTLDKENQLAGLLFSEANLEGREKLSAQMIAYVRNFIHTGNPSDDSLIQEWYPWSNAEGSAKAIVFDATLTDLNLRVDYEGVSKEAAQAAIDAMPDPDLRESVKAFLLAFPISCALLSDDPSADCGV
jgi:para-nitrobenzyl esterase